MKTPALNGRGRALLVLGGSLGMIAGAAMASGALIVPQAKMGDPLPGLTPAQLAAFLEGQIDYNTTLTVEDGLGPVFNKESCGNCHSNPLGGTGSQTVTRAGFSSKGGFDPLAQFGGSLFQQLAINEDCAEVVPPEANVTSLRVSNGMLGYGLVEAIPSADIEALEQAPPGVSGVARMVEPFEAPGTSIAGRFGWKAQVGTILTFSADAALQEMGLTNRFITEDNDPNGIRPPALIDCDTVADPEDGPDGNGQHFIDRVTIFQRLLAQPPQTPRSGMTGEGIFNAVGCAECHHPGYVTSNDAGLEDALRNQAIRPYSDFLLHDMGLAADFIPDGSATERELKTPPLWGVRRRDPMWHDGRFGGDTFTNRITSVINEHGAFGSEGVDSVTAWDALSGADQTAMIAFLDSLGRMEFDHDGDNDVQLDDFVGFHGCFGGGPYTADDACAVHDINQDGFVDMSDFDSFLLAYDGPLDDCNYNSVIDLIDILDGTSLDADNDGVIDDCCPGDFDGSGEVGFSDLVALLSSWGACAGCPADIDGSGDVGFSDLVTLLSLWGSC